MCQAIFTMKIAKKYDIMVIVNKIKLLFRVFLSVLYSMHKSFTVFL